MTLVGKILVIVILFFSVVFLGLSTVVFTTAVDWKKAHAAQAEKIKNLNSDLTNVKSQLEVASKDLEKAKSDHTTVIAGKDKLIASLGDDVKRAQTEVTENRTKLETALQASNTALAEADQRRKETDLIREQRSKVEEEANKYKLQEIELKNLIEEQKRHIATIDANAVDLRDRVARFSTLLRRNGLSDDIRNVKGLQDPPTVEGEVKKVDAQNKKVEITIGSDDGLVPGHELHVYRTKPRPEYLGKIKIQSTDPDQAVGKVIGTTIQGKKIQEGDHVSSTIRPRS